MFLPFFPKLTPKLIDSAWFNIDEPNDDESDVTQLEEEHQAWLLSVIQRNSDVMPIGRLATDVTDDDEDEDDEDDNEDDEESESHDDEDEDEIEMDVSQDRNSPMDNIHMVQVQGSR